MSNEMQLKYGCNPNQNPSRVYMADGSEVKLNTGKTYVGIILNPNAERVQITE